MLLYNHKQEFIGIDEEGLRLLNYSSLDELLNVCSDVADLFANEPGYIHNFKNFGWINFLLHSDSDTSSAIVHANGRVFSCRLSVSKMYLCENPLQNGYSIEMSHIKSISGEDIKPHTIPPKTQKHEVSAPQAESTYISKPSPLPDYSHITPTQLNAPGVLDIPDIAFSPFDEIEDIYPNLNTAAEKPSAEETLQKLSLKESIDSPVKAIPVTSLIQKSMRYSAHEKEFLSHHKVENSYIYNPHVAASELGLPVDLIEEFIGDFIQQSLEFKEDLFGSAMKSDFNNLHILSHKLKGVAANLRIDDAFETLSIINASSDLSEIEANLKYYFEIISKLSGEESVQEDMTQEVPDTQTSNTVVSISSEEPAAAITDKTLQNIYPFGLKQYDDEPLLVHEEEMASSEEVHESLLPKESIFKKEFLDLDNATIETEKKAVIPKEAIRENIVIKLPVFHYDSQSVARELGMEKSFFDELLFDYKNDARVISNQITQAIIAFDTHTWRESAAKLKGISDNLRLSEISEELAILSKTNDAQEAKKASVRLNNYLDQL
ncbi:MAG: hypothetical protein PHQ22_02555 [Sulfuricurvum sp.]|nr:hypothetical protein [Sulfuricurvum sp.]MDD5386056.1 hypothetical protein [Sulfuricurvum sp.]